MDKKSKILIAVLFASMLVSIFFTYQRSFVDRNFIIVEETEEIEVNQ